MLRAATGRTYGEILDPAAGDGRLLEAAAKSWPDARIGAIDVDRGRAHAIAARHPDWSVQAADFLGLRCGAEPVTRQGPGARLVLLNPPFSGRGATSGLVDVGGCALRCSRAMAFLLEATEWVGDAGAAVALMPAGTLTNARDEGARAYLQQRGQLQVLATNPMRAFRGVVTRTVIVRWRPQVGARISTVAVSSLSGSGTSAIRVTRGALPVHLARERFAVAEPGAVPFLHTTSIRADGTVSPMGHLVPGKTERLLLGPLVLVPRVGRPEPAKVISIEARDPVVLSDCLFALHPRPATPAIHLRARLIEKWKRLESLYGGSCAPFLRLKDLEQFVNTIVLAEMDVRSDSAAEALVA